MSARMEGSMADTVDYTKEMKKKFNEKADPNQGFKDQLKMLSNSDLENMYQGMPSNIHIREEMKKRGLGKVK
jgi:hypothetical protein